MIFEKGSYLSLTAALQAIHADQAQNKIAMQMWLQSLGVDLEKIHVKTFVHMHLTTSKLIWNHVCHRNEKKALSVFLSRRWESDDLLECEHHVLKCLCWEYHSDRICSHPGCEKRPSFNFAGQPAKVCKEHAKDGMEDVVHKTCEFANCTTRPSFNFAGQPAKFCNMNKTPGMQNDTLKKAIAKPR